MLVERCLLSKLGCGVKLALKIQTPGSGYYSTPSQRCSKHHMMLALRRAAQGGLRQQRAPHRCLAAATPLSEKRWGPPAAPENARLPRGCLVGAVVSTAMAKTVNVDVSRTRVVPKYRKSQKYSRRFLAHDEAGACALGDVVRIAPCRPLSRRKHFVVQEVLRKAAGN